MALAGVLRIGLLGIGLLGPAVTTSAAAAAEALSISVDDDQRVTVVGEGDSLRAVLEDLCWRAGVSIRWDGTDRPVSAHIEGEPLEAALAKLLGSDSFVVTVKSTASAARRVTALHVLGAEGPSNRSRRVRVSPAPTFVLPLRILEGAFAEDDAARRATAIRELVATVRDDPEQLRAFLAADVEPMGVTLRQYPEAPAVLRELLALPDLEDAVRAKLIALAATLE